MIITKKEIYVKENVRTVINALRKQGFRVDYKPKMDDPEYANGYLILNNDYHNITLIISSVIRWRKVLPGNNYPKDAQACLQIVQTQNIKSIINAIYENLSVL